MPPERRLALFVLFATATLASGCGCYLSDGCAIKSGRPRHDMTSTAASTAKPPLLGLYRFAFRIDDDTLHGSVQMQADGLTRIAIHPTGADGQAGANARTVYEGGYQARMRIGPGPVSRGGGFYLSIQHGRALLVDRQGEPFEICHAPTVTGWPSRGQARAVANVPCQSALQRY
ncbi:hypothetical protein EII20_02440 [Comamonadaceae bacterium OH2545_COT-014]|nr:hypothetical protein EII20_02440 [Comamonadaceae bacterium OH2545_COT-014]